MGRWKGYSKFNQHVVSDPFLSCQVCLKETDCGPIIAIRLFFLLTWRFSDRATPNFTQLHPADWDTVNVCLAGQAIPGVISACVVFACSDLSVKVLSCFC